MRADGGKGRERGGLGIVHWFGASTMKTCYVWEYILLLIRLAFLVVVKIRLTVSSMHALYVNWSI